MEVVNGTVPEWVNSDGYGSGYGSGSGDGDGDGDGSGYGYSSGDGSGYGSGYGYGYSYSSGDGSGYGSGYGYSDGDGDGDGDGSGSKEYWEATIPYFASKWSQEQRSELTAHKKAGSTIAFWRSGKDGRACNGGYHSKPVRIGMVEKIPGPLRICTENGLHATVIPPNHSGDRWWIVALVGEIQWSDDKCAALERHIIGECL